MKQVVITALLLVALQCVSLCSGHNALSQKVTLKFSFCARDKTDFESASFYVGWNGATVFDHTPQDYQIHYVSIKLESRVGENTLNFVGTGASDAQGMTIDNVRVERECGCGFENLVINGEFHEAVWVDQSWRYFYEEIRGWKSQEIQIGNGRYYNSRLPHNNPVTELDASKNVDMFQIIYLDQAYRRVKWYFGAPAVLG